MDMFDDEPNRTSSLRVRTNRKTDRKVQQQHPRQERPLSRSTGHTAFERRCPTAVSATTTFVASAADRVELSNR